MELLMTIAVLAILTTLAVPAFNRFILNNRLAGQANEFVAATQLARSEAIKRGVDVAVCSSDDAAACGGSFTDGWIVLADPGGADQVIQVYPSPGDDFSFTPASGNATFSADGFSTAAAEIQLDITLTGCTNDNARRILVERTGRVSSRRVDCP